MMQVQEIHIKDYLRVAYKRRQLIATFFVVTLVVAILGVFSVTPLYEANAQILIEKNDVNPMVPDYGFSRYDSSFFATQYEIIKSFNVSRKVVDMLSLDQKYAAYFLNKSDGFTVLGWFRSLFDGQHAAGNALLDGNTSETNEVLTEGDIIATIISENINVEPVRRSKIVNISYKSENPILAKMITNTITEAYREEVLAIRMSTSEYAIKWMTDKAEDELAKLEKSEKALQKYVQANDIVTVEDKIAIIPEKLSEFSSQLSKIEARRKELESIQEKIKTIDPQKLETLESLPIISTSSSLLALREKIQEAEKYVVELSKKYGHKHPVMIRAKGDLQVLREKKEQEVLRLVESIKNEYELAKSNEENLSKLLGKTKKEVLGLNERLIQYSILKREVDTNKALYDALLKKIKEQKFQEDAQGVRTWVMTEAKTPKSPAWPNRFLSILGAIGLGLFGGVALAFFIEYLDNTVKSPEDAEARLGITVLGMVEFFQKQGVRVEDALRKEPMSSFAECYKSIRSAVLLSSADHPPKSIMVTSMSPQEGKTTTAANLAMTIAQAGHNVVLIDGDLRRPTLHKRMGLKNTKGLSTYLAGASDMDIVAEYPLESLSIIPSGPTPPNPSELIGSRKMKELMEKLVSEYDFVIIDSAPVMGATDASIVSKLVEGTIVVSRADVTTYEALQIGLKSLADINAHVLGMVINAVDLQKTHYHRYYGYYNYSSDSQT